MSEKKWIGSAVMWTLLILYLLLMPGEQSSDPWWYFFPHIDKLIHTGIFTVWSFLVGMSLLDRENGKTPVVTILGLVLAIVTEVAQAFIDGRSASTLDALADMIGVLVGIVATFYVKKNLISTK
ncbi:VanZ family protein [Reichenbachiella versicolor]|uniref:VanZ family protein n=1 Tax=Reichenbachiella versicolor TaxID=1821036 RepID=UPI000D6DD787|nr:VanZ family protein [Reichenbachiella versicolor]